MLLLTADAAPGRGVGAQALVANRRFAIDAGSVRAGGDAPAGCGDIAHVFDVLAHDRVVAARRDLHKRLVEPVGGTPDQRFLPAIVARSFRHLADFGHLAGRESPYFFNAGASDDGESIGVLGRCYAAALVRSGVSFDMLFSSFRRESA